MNGDLSHHVLNGCAATQTNTLHDIRNLLAFWWMFERNIESRGVIAFSMTPRSGPRFPVVNATDPRSRAETDL